MIFYTLPWSRWDVTHKYVRCTVCDRRIRSAASTLKYEPLDSCITVHNVWIMKIFNVMLLNTCTRDKRRKNCEEFRWRSQSAPVRPLAMPSLIDAKISLVPKHQAQSTFNLIDSCNKHPNIQSHKAAKPQRYIRSHHLHMSYFCKIAHKRGLHLPVDENTGQGSGQLSQKKSK